jgi:beta-barrel assembly-enhancing protease
MGMYGNDPNQGQSRGIGSRLLIAIAIALVGWFMYMNQVEVNPVTGKKQHVAISPDQEIKLGLESAPQMSREMGGEVPSSDPRAQVVVNLGDYLVRNTIAKKSPWQFKFHLLADDKTINAFALPGGQIFITLGLLDKLENEAELAGVLGHEMGHVIERHTAEQMAKDRLGKTMVMAAGTAASDHGSTGFMVAAFVNQMLQLRYSRQDESEADMWGIRLMSEAGFNPRAMIQVMQVLKAAGGAGHQVEMFQTHPNPDLRMQQIDAYLKENPPAPDLSDGHPLKYLYEHPEDVGPTSTASSS